MWKRLLNQTKATTAAAAASDLVARRKPSSPSPTRRAAPGVSSDVLLRLKQAAASNDPSLPPDEEDASLDFSKEIMSILHGSDDADESAPPEGKSDAGEAGNKILGMKWFSPPSQSMAQWRKEVSREKKKRYIFKNTESRRFTRLMRMSAERLGTDSTLEFFGKLGRETGLKEFNALIKLSIDGARSCKHDDMVVDQIHRAHRLFVLMRERGFLIDEQSYGPFLLYLVDMRMTEEFKLFSRFFKDANPKSHSRIAYYEMLLWIGVEDEEKIQELCRTAEDSGVENQHKLLESYILAFAESDRKMDLISLLEVLDLTKVSNSQYISRIFKSLGRFKLENYMEKFLQEMCSKESTVGNISSLIIDYAANIPNIVVRNLS